MKQGVEVIKPFFATPEALNIAGHYPSKENLADNLTGLSYQERRSFIRLWASEGIPQIFSGAPILYDIMRYWIASRLNVEPKNVTVIGSVRMGYSLSPEPKFGTPFTNAVSDLDMSVVSQRKVDELIATFETWREDYASGNVKPRSKDEEGLWDDNSNHGIGKCRRGFIDHWMVPTFDKYPVSQSLGQLMYETRVRFGLTPQIPSVKSASLRIYRDWDAFIDQQQLSLALLIKSL